VRACDIHSPSLFRFFSELTERFKQHIYLENNIAYDKNPQIIISSGALPADTQNDFHYHWSDFNDQVSLDNQ
jgi:hypothetical protein